MRPNNKPRSGWRRLGPNETIQAHIQSFREKKFCLFSPFWYRLQGLGCIMEPPIFAREWNHFHKQGWRPLAHAEELAGDRLNEPWAEGWNGDTQPLGYTQYTLHGYPKIGHVTYMCIMLSITSSYPCPTIKQAQFSDLGSNRIVKPKVQTLCMSTP